MRSRRLSNFGGALLVAALCSLGCAFGEIRMHDPLQREYSLEETQKRYSDLVRFSNFELAARFVAPEFRNDYVAQMPKEQDLRFLDYESQALAINEDLNRAKLQVTYTAYSPWTLITIEIREDQVWTRPEGISNSWSVASTFHGLAPYRRKSAQSMSDAR